MALHSAWPTGPPRIHWTFAPKTPEISRSEHEGDEVGLGVHENRATPKLLKIGVRIRVSVRAVRLSFDEGFPEAGLFGQVLARLQSLPLRC